MTEYDGDILDMFCRVRMDKTLDKFTYGDHRYQKTSKELDIVLSRLSERLSAEDSLAVDQAFCLYNEQASSYALLAYKLGFSDQHKLLQQMDIYTKNVDLNIGEKDINGRNTMKSIIEELFNGDIRPLQEFQPILKSYKKKWDRTMKEDNRFIEKLDDDLKEEFEKLMDDHFELIPLEMAEVYSSGVKMGVRLMCEVFYDEEGTVE